MSLLLLMMAVGMDRGNARTMISAPAPRIGFVSSNGAVEAHAYHVTRDIIGGQVFLRHDGTGVSVTPLDPFDLELVEIVFMGEVWYAWALDPNVHRTGVRGSDVPLFKMRFTDPPCHIEWVDHPAGNRLADEADGDIRPVLMEYDCDANGR